MEQRVLNDYLLRRSTASYTHGPSPLYVIKRHDTDAAVMKRHDAHPTVQPDGCATLGALAQALEPEDHELISPLQLASPSVAAAPIVQPSTFLALSRSISLNPSFSAAR